MMFCILQSQVAVTNDACSTGGFGARFALLREVVWVVFLYSISNRYSHNCIFQPSGNPTIISFPLGPAMLSPLIRNWVWEKCMKLLYVIQVFS